MLHNKFGASVRNYTLMTFAQNVTGNEMNALHIRGLVDCNY